jgi:hypothetical protein
MKTHPGKTSIVGETMGHRLAGYDIQAEGSRASGVPMRSRAKT